MSIFLITGTSGAGKTSLTHELKKCGYWDECISHTTRPMRTGEVDGEDYYFVSKEEFKRMYENNEFVECVIYHGDYYGVSHAEIERTMKKGNHIFIIVAYDGYLQIKEQYPDAIGIFIWATKEDCVMNMLGRGDSLELANKRISTYEKEILHRDAYDYVIKNVRGKFSDTASILKGIVNQYNNY